MLKIKDKNGRTKFILADEDECPISIDEIVLQEAQAESKLEKEKQDAPN